MNPERLIFRSKENATEFTERVEGRIAQEQKPGVSHAREVVAQELAHQFEVEGHGVSSYAHPWEHSQAEHAEAQQLVNIAFAHDLTAAIRQAEQSPLFPRNIDLFHDVLTGKMYEAMSSAKLNAHHVPSWIIFLIAVFFSLLLGAILLFSYTI